MEKMRPMLLTTWKSYSKEQFFKDLIAGIVVAIIALPLSIALALASGVGPEQGIYTAIVAGFVISLLGGSQVQIAGPTAAFATIVAGIVARSGMDGLAVATILAGIILIIMGFCRFGAPVSYTHLDVYKRQIKRSSVEKSFSVSEADSGRVSYTAPGWSAASSV